MDITTADASLAAGDYAALSQRIEGTNYRHIAQRQFALGFWVMSPKTGTHCVSFRNSGNDRSYIVEYTVSAANTWEYKTVTVSASPTAGTWDYATGVGIDVSWALAAGSTFQTTANAWQTGNYLGTSSQVNCLDSASNFFRLTGIQLEAGPIISTLPFSDFETELTRCQRYYQKSFSYGTAPAQNAGTGGVTFVQTSVGASSAMFFLHDFHMTLRAAPTMVYFNPSAANAQIRNTSNSTDATGTTTNTVSDGRVLITGTTSGSSSANQVHAVHWTADAEL